MSMKENALYSGLNRGGCSLMGEDVTPTLISGVSKQFGTTQDKLNVMVLNDQGGAVMNTSEDIAGALRAQEHGHQPIVYGISAYESNGMKSPNPHSGIYEADTTRTLDNNGGNPACNQGGMIVLEGNGSRPSHKGDGYAESEVSYTLNAVEQHAVCLENHPADSRVKIVKMVCVRRCPGVWVLGGGNVPMVMENAVCIGNGQTAQTRISDKVGALNCMHDQQAVMQGISGDVAGTLDASYYKGCGERQGVEREVVAYARQAIGEYKKSNYVSTLTQRDYKDATDLVVCVGNGRLAQARISDKVGALNCMHDQQAILISTKGNDNAETRNQILRLLQETYGEKTIFKWGIAILERLQQTDILQQGVHESGIQSETENWQKLDDSALPRPSVVTEWLLRDMWQREECGCSPQGRKSTEQRFEQSDESMPELSQQNSQTCKDLFDMWEKGKRLGVLRQTLSEIQEVWQSFNGKGQSVHGCSIVRRLTPLEAERLQGYPDHWTDIGEWTDSKGKKHKDADSPRYKALGNSIALPFWEWMAKRMAQYLPEGATMASLFSGIGGFELVFARAGVKPIWNSEIESFPEAVTTVHFGDDERGIKGDYERYL